ncbi:MAG: hypothetical protein AB1607_00195 [Chloroflexota bacterium]
MTGFDDAFHKFERGEKHLVEFYKNVIGNLKKDKVRFKISTKAYRKPDTDSRKYWKIYTLYVAYVPVIAIEDCILLGEVIQSFRSSLDYLAWALVAKYCKRVLTEREKRGVQFPMSPNRSHFRRNVGKMLVDVPSRQWAFFEQYQPYKRSLNGKAVRFLQALSNTDKHRIIVPAMLAPEYSKGNISYGGGDIVKTTFHLKESRSVRAGAKIVTILLAGDVPKQYVHMDTNLSVIPAFPTSVLKFSKSQPTVLIEPSLQMIRNACFEVLTRAKKFF